MSHPRLFVPYTDLQPATKCYLADRFASGRHTEVTLVDVSGDHWAYTDYLQARWDERADFINLEHDIVPHPGAIDTLWECPQPWCFHGYIAGMDHVANGSAPLGLMKITVWLMTQLPAVWKDMRAAYRLDPNAWMYNDIHLMKTARDYGLTPHEHTPPVFNANPSILEIYAPDTPR